MHPIKDIILDRDKDLTPKFKDFVRAIIVDAKKALVLADCDCPYPAENQIGEILSSVREATQVVTTVANDYQIRVPDNEDKEAQIREAWKKAREFGETCIDDPKSDESVRARLNDLCRQYVAQTGNTVHNCAPGHNSAGDFALWLAQIIVDLEKRIAVRCTDNRALRNCDKGTADEQLELFIKKWESVGYGEIDERSIHMMSIFSRWAQLRYGSEVSDESK